MKVITSKQMHAGKNLESNKADMAMDKKMGYKEGSSLDNMTDTKMMKKKMIKVKKGMPKMPKI